MTKKKRGTRVVVKSYEGTLVATPVDRFARVSYKLPSGRKFWTVVPIELLEYPSD